MSHVVDGLIVENDAILSTLVLPPALQAISLNGSLVLSVSAPTSVVLTGSATGYSVLLPNCTSEEPGHVHNLFNTTNELISIKDASGTQLVLLAQNSVAYCFLQSAGTTNGVWLIWQALLSSVASGVISYNVISSTPFTTSSPTDVVITGFSLTPQAGTYAVWYNASATCSQNNSDVEHSIYRGGLVIADSLRHTQSVSANFNFQQSTQTIAAFSGAETCDVRVSTNQGSHTVLDRSLLMIRIGI